MYFQIEEEFNHVVDDMAFDAIRKRGQFAAHATPQHGASVTYVLANPNQQTQNTAPPNASLPPPLMQANPPYQYTSDIRSKQGQAPGMSNIPNATIVPPTAKYHTSPNKVTGSPGQYLILGPGGGYYQQYTQE